MIISGVRMCLPGHWCTAAYASCCFQMLCLNSHSNSIVLRWSFYYFLNGTYFFFSCDSSLPSSSFSSCISLTLFFFSLNFIFHLPSYLLYLSRDRLGWHNMSSYGSSLLSSSPPAPLSLFVSFKDFRVFISFSHSFWLRLLLFLSFDTFLRALQYYSQISTSKMSLISPHSRGREKKRAVLKGLTVLFSLLCLHSLVYFCLLSPFTVSRFLSVGTG